jgi:hypothetical protein
MNHLALEQAVKAALAASAFPATAIYTGSGYDILEPQSSNLIVSCQNARQEGIGLYVADVTVRLTAPALQGADSYASFDQQLNILRDALTPVYMNANWPITASAPAFFGMWVESSSTTSDNNAWSSEHSVSMGIGI